MKKILIQELDGAHTQMSFSGEVTGNRSRIYRIINRNEVFELLEDLMKSFNVNRLEIVEHFKNPI